ncbi:MAG: cytochrome-c peroxidase, partial [Bacteroidia bacterium]|nr:cytochrome-c peroxidase [Bacteroidia bacterium]
MKKVMMYFAVIFIVVTAFQQVRKHTFGVPYNWPKPVFDFKKQPLIPAQILLGRVLFYDPLLSRNNTVSCASCHSQYTAFTHVDHSLSHGIDDRIGTRNSPALMNLAWSSSFMWDGSMSSLQQQVFSPITHPQEMDENLLRLTGKLQRSSLYSELFYSAFQDSTITAQRIAIALEQFML